MKLKGIELKGTYKFKCDDTCFEVRDEKGNMIYLENSNGVWIKWEYDEKGNEIYFEDSNGFWEKNEYNKEGIVIYRENNKGKIIDKRVKELTIEEVEKLLGYKIKIKGEK